MEKKSFGKLLFGKWNTVTIVSVAVGAALFGVLMVYASIQVFTNTYLSAAMIVPVFIGSLFGPIPACVTMLVGNMVADLIGGWGFWFDWSVGNGVLGLFIGALPLYGARIDEGLFNLKHMIIYAICCIVGNIVAFGVVTPLMTTLFYAADLEVTLLQSLFSAVANAIILLAVGIPVLIMMAARFKKRGSLVEED